MLILYSFIISGSIKQHMYQFISQCCCLIRISPEICAHIAVVLTPTAVIGPLVFYIPIRI